MNSEAELSAEAVAKLFHETYERLAIQHGYETRKESAKPWDQVPMVNKGLMIEVCEVVLTHVLKDSASEQVLELLRTLLGQRLELRRRVAELQAHMTVMHNEAADKNGSGSEEKISARDVAEFEKISARNVAEFEKLIHRVGQLERRSDPHHG